ncbi:MAG: NAD(P)/FAD-dependent oxidoreductase [Anaerolineae bacterium]|jgi:glutathione reductase (NADPH)
MPNKFDLIVIGSGAAGSTVAHKCRSAGWEVAVIDSRPFGGTCALRGCDPKKVLVDATQLMDWNRRMLGHGLTSGDIHIDWPALMRFKGTFTEPVPEEYEQGFAEAGIATFHGRTHFIDQTTLEINEERLSSRYVVIAAGAKPATLNIPGEEHLTSSTQFLELRQIPRQILFVGGGYISFEFAHIAARAGAHVRILHNAARPLAGFDPDLVDQLVQATREIGVDVRVNSPVKSIEKKSGHFIVRASTGNGEQSFEANMVIHGAGRVPEIDDLDLEKAGVEREKRGVVVNEYLQSVSNPAVYAAGDAAAAGLPLTPVARMEGGIVASNLLEGNQHKPDFVGVPTVLFTAPALAGAGLQEKAAREQGLKFRVNQGDTSSWYTSSRIRMKHTGFKVLIGEESESILGAHLLIPHAEDVINLFAIAIRFGLAASDLKRMVYAYPTSSSDISYML